MEIKTSHAGILIIYQLHHDKPKAGRRVDVKPKFRTHMPIAGTTIISDHFWRLSKARMLP